MLRVSICWMSEYSNHFWADNFSQTLAENALKINENCFVFKKKFRLFFEWTSYRSMIVYLYLKAIKMEYLINVEIDSTLLE